MTPKKNTVTLSPSFNLEYGEELVMIQKKKTNKDKQFST
jgi:hypothetical protein